jgi:uncharacterized protein
MTGRRIVIAGASGFVGRYLAAQFLESGDTVSTIGRSGADARWGDSAAIGALLDGSDILINLAGKSVNCRYTRKNKAAIFSSRLLTTAELGEVVQSVRHPPKVWFNASTATIYRHADDHPMTDETGELGSGFSVNVATAWEREFFAHPRAGARQRFSWVHIEDVHRAIEFLSGSPDLGDTVNVCSPNPVENRELMATLRRVLGVRIGVPLFGWMLETGAFAIRTETELLLKSRWVVPTRLLAGGFEFEFPNLEGALRDILPT